jgi:DNA-binding MarR family transcriptional regulator
MADEHELASGEVQLDPQNLRGLAHPLRLKLLGLLREDGPSTATKLADRLGQSSGATSYHLRQLEAYGFVVEDPDRTGPGRERWWKAAHWRSNLTAAQVREAPEVAEGFLRALALEIFEHINAFMSEIPTRPEEWDEGAMLSDANLLLTLDEAKQLRSELRDLIDRYRQNTPGVVVPAGAEQVFLQVQLMPRVRRDEPAPESKEA